jgi:hypothetical protein
MKVTTTIQNAERFRRWVKQFGVLALSAALAERGHAARVQAIYQWLNGSAMPTAPKIRAMVDIAAGAIEYREIHDYIALATEAFAAGVPVNTNPDPMEQAP